MVHLPIRRLLNGFLLLFFLGGVLCADDFSFDDDSSPSREDPVRFELISEETTVQHGQSFWIALHITTDDHWHSYWKHPGDIGMPTQVEWNLPEGYTISDLQWPYPQKFEQNGFVGFGFDDATTLLAEVTPATSSTEAKNIIIEANIRWLVCSDESCLPGETALTLEMPISKEAPTSDGSKKEFFERARAQLPHSNWETAAHAHDGFIDLQVKNPEGKPLTSAYFCPEGKEIINTKVAATLSSAADSEGNYRLLLTSHDKGIPSALKGVLVVEADGHKQALAIDHDLSSEDSLISMSMGSQAAILHDTKALEEPEPMEFDGGIGLALFLAFIGGAILNLMPCVLPVVSFKILSFIKMAGQSRALIFKHGLAFSAGVLLSFWVLAGIMLSLQSYGQAVGWGFQLQEPLFVAALAALLLLFSLSLFGVFEMGTSVTAWAGNMDAMPHSSALGGSFFSGILATAVATPCTGPFLGSAIGFAVTLPTFWALLIFTSLGLGMASPYLLMAAFPSLLRFMPRPGAWMTTFKEVLGFVMLATVLWLVWVFAAQTNTFSIFMLLVAFFILSFGAWIFGRWGSVANKKRARVVSTLFAAICIGLAGYTIVLSTSPELLAVEDSHSSHASDGWETFSPERVAELQAAGTPVLIDFTAKWCLICQANHLILSVDQVEDAMEQAGVVKMKADWTKNDPVITKALKQFGRNGVPLYVLYTGDTKTQPVILPQVLTPEAVLTEINKLDSSTALK